MGRSLELTVSLGKRSRAVVKMHELIMRKIYLHPHLTYNDVDLYEFFSIEEFEHMSPDIFNNLNTDKDLRGLYRSVLLDPHKICNLSSESLVFVSKRVLLTYFAEYLPRIFLRLPFYLQSDIEILMHLPCRSHFAATSLPWAVNSDKHDVIRKNCYQCIITLDEVHKSLIGRFANSVATDVEVSASQE